MQELILIIHNVRSCHNVGSMLRSAEGLGVNEVVISGYTPYPKMADDPRLPHLSAKIDKQITKTSLGAEKTLRWRHEPNIERTTLELKVKGYTVAALEQTKDSINLFGFTPPDKLALIVGREVEGIEPEVLQLCDQHLEIPMAGKKESFNVSVAAAMALFYLKNML